MRVSFPAKAVLSDLPLKQEKAKVTLQLVVNTDIRIMTGGISGGQDFAKVGGPRETLRKMDVRRVAIGQEESVLSLNQALSKAADGLPEHEQSAQIPKSTARRSPQLQIAQRNCWT